MTKVQDNNFHLTLQLQLTPSSYLLNQTGTKTTTLLLHNITQALTSPKHPRMHNFFQSSKFELKTLASKQLKINEKKSLIEKEKPCLLKSNLYNLIKLS